ncbi:MAG: HNH endonuclease [Aggregatilineales bacterium]
MSDLERLKAVIAAIRNRRARIVAEHILAHGSVTTEELSITYGYTHPPRAARDLRELGIPIETFKVKSSTGRTIAAYRFADLAQTSTDQSAGRRAFSKQFKRYLIETAGARCAICQQSFEERHLQIDHRIPYSIAGDGSADREPDSFMLLCAPCNRAKGWSCEHCPNQTGKSAETCRNCYWASPQAYTHVATQPIRRLELVWRSDEVQQYDDLATYAQQQGLSLADYIKRLLQALLDQQA